MNSKKSWVNVPLLKNTIKQNTLFAKVSLVVVCVFSVVGIINDSASVIAIMSYGISCVLLTTCYAGFVQKYMTHKTEAGFVASLPISTFTLWLTQYLAGLLLVIGTLLIESVFIAFMTISSMSIDMSPILLICTTIFLAIFYYTVSFFVSCMAGNRLGQFVYTVIFYALPLLLYIGVEMLAGTLAPYANGFVTSDLLFLVVPLVSGLECLSDGSWPYFMGHVVLIVAFLVGGYYVFKYRNIENTGSALLNKKVNFFLKIIVAIALTLFMYIIITRIIIIIPNYTFSNIVKAGCIFIILGILLALMLEMLFHNQHMYKSLIYYVPALQLCFVGCYVYGNYQYQELINVISKSDQVELFYYAFEHSEQDEQDNIVYGVVQNSAGLTMNGKTAKKIIDAIDNKDIISSNVLINSNNPMELSFTIKEESDRGLTIYVPADVVKRVLEKDEKIIREIAEGYYTFDTSILGSLDTLLIADEHYGTEQDMDAVYEETVISVLDTLQIQQLKEYIDSEQYINIDNVFVSTYSAMYEKGYFNLLSGDCFINSLIYDENAVARAEQLNQCSRILKKYYDEDTMKKWKEKYPEVFSEYSFYLQEEKWQYNVEFIDDHTITMQVLFNLETEDYETAGIVKAKCTFTWQDNKMVLTNIEKVGDK